MNSTDAAIVAAEVVVSSLPRDVSRCAGVCCEVREACARFTDRDQRHGDLWPAEPTLWKPMPSNARNNRLP